MSFMLRQNMYMTLPRPIESDGIFVGHKALALNRGKNAIQRDMSDKEEVDTMSTLVYMDFNFPVVARF